MPNLPKIYLDAEGKPYYRCTATGAAIRQAYGVPLLGARDEEKVTHAYWGERDGCYIDPLQAVRHLIKTAGESDHFQAADILERKLIKIKEDLQLPRDHAFTDVGPVGPDGKRTYLDTARDELKRAMFMDAKADATWRAKNIEKKEGSKQGVLYVTGSNKDSNLSWQLPIDGTLKDQHLIHSIPGVNISGSTIVISNGNNTYVISAKKNKDFKPNGEAFVDEAGLLTSVGVPDKKKRAASRLSKKPKTLVDDVKSRHVK